MSTHRLLSLALGSLFTLILAVGCSGDDAADGDGSAGKAGSNTGTGATSGTSSTSGSSGSAGASSGATSDDRGGATGDGGKPSLGAAGEPGLGGAAGETGGVGGAEVGSCTSVRASLLAPIDTVSTGLVSITSEPDAATVTAVIDASAGGIQAAATSPYIYVSLANEARVDISDVEADTSTAWDLAFKRDNIRSNGGDSGAGQARVAALDGASFDAVTAADATTASFGQDDFVDEASCDPIVDATGKPLTGFDGWYDYDLDTMRLTPADKVFLVRAADGTSLFALQITGYYVDVSDGAGGTVKKSAVYSIRYRAL